MSELVAEPVAWSAPGWWEGQALGIPVLGSAFSVGAEIGAGDWAGALGSGIGVVGDAVGMAVDPLGTLASSIAGFLLERFWLFQEALDVLAGDPAVVTAIGITWSNIANHSDQQAARLIALRDSSVAWWQGAAGDAFRERLTQQAEQLACMAFTGNCLNVGFAIGSAIVTVVREIVTAICAELVGKLIVWVGEALATAGFGIPVIVAQATSAIARWFDDAARWMDELLMATGKFGDLLADLYRAFDDLSLLDLGITPDVVGGAGVSGADQAVQTATG